MKLKISNSMGSVNCHILELVLFYWQKHH